MEQSQKQNYTSRLLTIYREEIISKMKAQFGYSNDLSVPRLLKIVVNMGIGAATTDNKLVDKCAKELGLITGQRPKITCARKAISNFKVREGMPIGCCVTMRKHRMYDFLDRLITVAMPRIRDFRGFFPSSFDGRGNYTFGLGEQTVFPELNIDKIERTQGMNITINTSAHTDEEARQLLAFFGFPFRKTMAREDN